MIRRTFLGLDVSSEELRGVSLQRKGKTTRLTGARVIPLPAGAIQTSLREPIIRDLKALAEGVREVLQPLAGREEQVAVSLPDGAGRLLFTEVDAPFKSRKEGEEILRWRLKGDLPVEPQKIRLDYQVLDRRDAGRLRVAVAVMAGVVLDQLEEVLIELGFFPRIVDFHSLNLYNFYRPRLDLGEDFVLLGIEGATLSLQFFQGGTPMYHRVREVREHPEAILQELNRTLVSMDKFPSFRKAGVFLHSTWASAAELISPLETVFEREVTLLDPRLDKLLPVGANLASGNPRALAAAIGAAERLM